jgi:cation-transporting ATPase 13A1
MVDGIVDSETVELSQLLVPKNPIFKPYVWPFLIVYPAYNYLYTNYYDVYFVGREWTFIYTLLLVSIHALVWLLPRWNLDLRVSFEYDKVSQLKNASYILLKAKPSFGLSEICKIEFNPGQISFKYQKRKFLYNPKLAKFAPPKYFVDDKDLSIKELKSLRGLPTDKVPSIEKHYGLNTFDIPVPSFIELFIEHMLAPFFVFQLFSISLWLMDEMWYLSIFSLIMLFSFEATTVYQRKSTMTEFQSMGIKPYDIWVYRDQKWIEIKTDHLLPGDIVSIVRTPHEDLSIPCDMLLLQGSCIVNEAMLSGESTPLLKESIETRENDSTFEPDNLDKNSLLHGGTSCLQVTVPEKPIIPLAPDNGTLALVTKTGFETTQGSLVRVMIFSSERMSVANKEAFLFILFLLVFAVIAARYVWIEGTKMGRKQSKLILDCIIVLTSVVPPELPMELTMAVNQSLAALAKHYIFCTEPFRIPVAGRIDVCCFDKTGTLTAEDLFFEGLAGFNTNDQTILSKCDSAEVPTVTLDLLGSVHALVRLDDGDVVGDPMEKETVKVSGWKLDENVKNTMVGHGKKIKILKRFQFSSSLKRSSVISKVNDKILVGVKGAPETISERLITLPEDYESTYKYFTRNGSRVLALAYKYLNSDKNLDKIERKSVEADLIFAGFIVFHCPMKNDAIETIQMLNQSSHRCVMITGDNPLTACHVANKVGIITKDVLILDKPEKNHPGDLSLEWRNVEETRIIPVNKDITFDMKFLRENDLCITGYALNELIHHPQISTLIRHSWIYSRVSPSQKEYILNTYKNLGYNTLMCGDGTNDVGALKQANVGIALLNGTEESLKQMQENKKIETYERMYQKQCELMKKWNQPPPKIPVQIAHLYPPGPLNPHYLKALEQHGTTITQEIRDKVDEAFKNAPPVTVSTDPTSANNITDSLLSQLQETQEADEAPVLKLGDASVAAPFTSKLANVSTVVNVIRQGRCALVSTIQMYKILALNCLISAYSLSVLYLAGIKFGDAQATVSGILLSVCFMSISRGKAIEKLSKERPQPGIFNIYIMGSILGQFAIHLVALIYITKEIYILEPREPQIDLDKTFQPSLLNTAMFLLQLSQQISTFTVNYIGRPFRESIHENKGMYYGILGVAFLCISGSTEFMPELNEAMQFVPMTGLFKVKLTVTMLLDFFVAWAIEIVLKYFFMDFKAADIADRTYDNDIEIVKSDEEKKNQ